MSTIDTIQLIAESLKKQVRFILINSSLQQLVIIKKEKKQLEHDIILFFS